MSSCLTSASDEVIKPLRVQRYNKKMIYANKMRKNSPKVPSNRPKKNQHAGWYPA